jgi:hypothetical protein
MNLRGDFPDGQNSYALFREVQKVQSLSKKFFGFAVGQNTFRDSRVSCSDREGRIAIVTTRWARDAMDVDSVRRGGSIAPDENAFRIRRSRVVLTPRRWRQVLKKLTLLRDDGGKKARSPGRARRKP